MIFAFVAVVGLVVAVDLITKFTVPGILNPGISWGLGAELPWLWIVVVAFSAVVVAVAVWYVATHQKSWVLTLGIALFVGGVLGNAIDRLITGGVVHDFINFGIFQNNVADIAICVGAVVVGVKLAFG